MNSKLAIFTALLIGLIPEVSAVDDSADHLEPLAIAFLVLCAIILVIALIVPFCLHRRSESGKGMRSGSSYDMNKRESRLSGNYNDSVGVYGYYTDPQPTGSIYLPLSDRRIDNENGYAHLSDSPKPQDKEGQHTYESLKNSNTFTRKENAYDNPGAVIDDDKDDGSEHDYEVADASVNVKGPDYENPVSPKEDTAL